ncbi:MAG: J domain-containing protein [Opitutus sp.]
MTGTSAGLRFLRGFMPGTSYTHLRHLRSTRTHRKAAPTQHSRALLVIDNAPLQRAAWAEFHAARKRHAKAARDLHLHEQTDVPAYEAWLHRTFPVLITTLREMHQEVLEKARRVQSVQALASLTGRSLKKLWKEQKAYEADPEGFRQRFEREDESDSWNQDFSDDRTEDDRFDGRGNAANRSRRNFGDSFDGDGFNARTATPSKEAKTIYRRLVQNLHPDRGGEFGPVRKRLWHEVQQAWAARDTDWLARIEVEWETANEVLGPTSQLSRLQRAINELQAARRDTERKLREYRSSTAWRFTRSLSKRPALHRRTEANFQHDLEFLKRQLAYLNATIASWETPRSRSARARNDDW